MEQMQSCRMLWQKRKDGGARLLRMYGESPHVAVPPQIAGRPCVEIAPYCFAPQARLPEGEGWQEDVSGGGQAFLKELCGKAVEEATLPDSVRLIGNCAFYNCRNLKRLHIGGDISGIGSDAFMNTLSLRGVVIRCGAGERSGIRQIVSQISAGLEVRFEPGGKKEAVLLYPEYYESYDEIAPAHLFGRSITGEGFRVRQCFLDGKVDFAGYDAVFTQACAEETEETLSKMALNRLQYPYALGNGAKEQYSAYIKSHIESLSLRLVRNKDLDALRFLCRERYLRGAALSLCAQAAADAGWAQGAAELLQLRAAGKKSRYEF